MYYGQDSTCNYNTGSTTSGYLTLSNPIAGIASNSLLNFTYWREVEYTSGSYDITKVDVSPNGSTWTQVWYLDSSTPSTLQWTSSGNISLATWAGQSLQLRFFFNSVDNYSNSYDGWAVDNISVTGSSWNCNVCNVTNNPPGRVLNTLTISKSGSDLYLAWSPTASGCNTTAYGIYRGTLSGTFSYNHSQLNCSVSNTNFTTPQDSLSYYYLVVPLNSNAEGSYGKSSNNNEIPQSSSPCKSNQNTDPC